MADLIVNVVGEKVVGNVVDSVASQVGYIWNYQSNLENLEKQLERLQGRKDMVHHSVTEAKRNGEEIEQQVANWLVRADSIIKAMDDNYKAEMKCLKSMCPNLKQRYQKSKTAMLKAKDISDLYDEGRFDRVSFRIVPKEIWHPSSKVYQELESRTFTLKLVIDALSRSDVTMVGIHGMGGVGKTVLARAVGEKAENSQMFDSVVFAEVSERLDDEKILEIQSLIASRLGMEFTSEALHERANKLINRLKREKKVLIILDNVWNELQWDKIGIPLNDDHRGCKVLLTARDINVLGSMDCQTKFSVDTLDPHETWELFKKIGGSSVEDPGLGALPSQIAKRCGGLPIAIVSTAKALKGKQRYAWEDALQQLEQCPAVSRTEEAISCLRLSYDCLESQELQATFVLCCTLTTMRKASFESLLTVGLSQNSFKRFQTMKNQRNHLYTLIDKLKSCSLLLGPFASKSFLIHDLVLVCGMQIAKELNRFVVNGTLHPYKRSYFGNLTWICMFDMVEIPHNFHCPNLTFFFLHTKTKLSLPSDYFYQMPKLEAVCLEGMNLSELPKSLTSLDQLRALYLKSCRLGDISIIGDILSLEILVLFNSGPKYHLLREEISKLKWLRYIDLRNSSFILDSTFDNIEELLIGMELRTIILDEVIDALNTADVTMVGIHGPGGIGKTTLAKQIGADVDQRRLFDYVIFVEVDIENVAEIQCLIADQLSMKFHDKTLSSRASQIFERLRNDKKILLILDNIKENLEWDKIGIPLNNDYRYRGCKVLLTSRSIDVLLEMGSRCNFSVPPLTQSDSWTLFRTVSGFYYDDDDILLGKRLAVTCNGLPLSIVTTAGALKTKQNIDSELVWTEVLTKFEGLKVSNKGCACIPLCYEMLESSELKSTFLLCCVLSLIRQASLVNLMTYGLGLNLFKRLDTMEDQRHHVHMLIDKLKASFLLLETSSDENFSAHDVVAEIGGLLASEIQNSLLIKHELKSSERSLLQNLTWVFLLDMDDIPYKLDCPNLKCFYLKTMTRISLPMDYFAGMPKLEVVHVEGMNLLEVPESLGSLKELRVLYLKSCQLGDISIIGDIVTLEILVLFDSQSEITTLPQCIGRLERLRFLDLRRSSFLIEQSVISMLTRLEELYTDGGDHQQIEELQQ